MIAKYHVVTEVDIKALLIRVEDFIGKGWKPQGGISSVIYVPNEFTGHARPDRIGGSSIIIQAVCKPPMFLQAMIFEVDD